MIKEFEKVKYKWEEQRKKYSEVSKNLSSEEKLKLINNLLEKDLWSYFQLITEILFDIASDDDTYIKLLEKVYLKVRNDMGSAPFFDMLVDLGKNKKDVGIKIYNNIQEESSDDGLKEVSGFILGGYSINDNTILDKLIKNKELTYPLTNTLIKAIMVKSENTKEICKKEHKFLDFVSQSDDERFLRELMNLYRFIYFIDKTHFYKKIKDLMKKKKSSINGMIWIFRERLKLSNVQLLGLAELTKDCDEYAIGELINSLAHNNLDYSLKEIKKISELFIYWINRDLEFKVSFFDYSLEALSKKNIAFLDYFLENYKKIKIVGKSLDYTYLFPRIFERLTKSMKNEDIIAKLLERKINEFEPKLFYKLSKKIIGKIYNSEDKIQSFNLFLPLAIKIQKISKEEEFINENQKSFNNLIKKENFDKLIDYISNLLEQLIFRKRKFNFEEIYTNLSKFKKLNGIVKAKLQDLEKDKKYSPIFWILNWERDVELKKAYLEEIENFLILSDKISNEKNEKNNIKSLLKSLGDEDNFWNNFSEIIFANKFIPRYDSILEPNIPNKDSYSDLGLELNDKKMFFEITKPKTNRNLNLDNGAVSVKNKLDKAIREKSKQFFSKKTFQEIKDKKRNDLFFIVVDSSSSTIDEYMIEDSFYGSLAIEFYRNDKTGEATPPKEIRVDNAIIKNKELISGLIYFKPQLVNIDGKIKFKLLGDIIPNSNAINKITPNDYKQLKKIIFK